jgi:hypothetical protein
VSCTTSLGMRTEPLEATFDELRAHRGGGTSP